MSTVIETIDIHVMSRRGLDEQIEAAVQQLQDVAALTRTHGILITRHQPGRYTAMLSDEVPYGVTRELII
ncbi:hypothetical protein [Pseudarthrobacter raffinosi]|uniref:hypothetical protein n=1 Tax=Pseudarthrobacter raffinosi TaxID=2953651 RepID=UPI00208EEFE6|nr:hypothetical protein [Pseudarthrobacter sp. MDT3-9]MCO4251255.1 hypothetical protein [Pseudarthrobacter sp. MDT3-9]